MRPKRILWLVRTDSSTFGSIRKDGQVSLQVDRQKYRADLAIISEIETHVKCITSHRFEGRIAFGARTFFFSFFGLMCDFVMVLRCDLVIIPKCHVTSRGGHATRGATLS